ncbi:MAG TPA: VTT domain-containing protein [Actinomycetota bacterium]|nr:VTT domain-containing protein [Actinomycetota bacterium]
MKKSPERRKVLLALAFLRALLGLLAIPAAKFLYREHFLWLAVMRPTKEVFLLGAFLARTRNSPSLLIQVALAGLPLAIAGVWLFYYLGRMYSREIKSGDLPGLSGRLLPPDKIKRLEKVLERKGSKLIFLGRLAAFPSSVVGATAGSTGMKSRQFLPPDGLGAVASIVEVMSVGYVLGGFFDKDDPVTSWTITGLGIIAAFALMFLLGRYLRRE